MSLLMKSINDDLLKGLYQVSLTKFDTDPLLLSVSAKDLADKNPGNYFGMHGDDRTAANISDDIIRKTEEIRRYYGKKLLWNSLNGKEATPIRARLAELLANRIKECTDNDVGLYWKLPYFYEEDLVYEEFKKKYNTESLSPLGNKRSNKFAKRLEFLKTTTSIQKNQKNKNFWFSDDNKDLYGIQIKSDNELLSLFEDMIARNPTPIFETYLKESRIDKLHFYKLYSFKLLKENNA